MATLRALEQQIFAKEGFRVALVPLDPKAKAFPAYEYSVMASNKWRISDWKTVRLAPYVTLLRGVSVYRGSGQEVRMDMRLGNLRDTYFDAEYGEPKPAATTENVVAITSAPSKREERRNT
jgi:hypothetical protein